MRVLSRLVNVRSAQGGDAHRRSLLNIMLLSGFVLIPVGLLLSAILDLLGPVGHLYGLVYPVGLFLLLAFAGLLVINHRYSGRVASVLFLLLLITIAAVIDPPADMDSGRSLLAFALPVIISSVLVAPPASFVTAFFASLVILSIGLAYQTMADPFAFGLLFAVALAAWLSARALERTMADLQFLNDELDQRVTERAGELRRRSVQLEAAAQVAQEATTTLNVDELLDATVQMVSETFGYEHAAVHLLDDSEEHVVLRSASSEGGRSMIARGHKVRVGEGGLVGHVARAGKARVLPDVSKEAVHLSSAELPDTRSAVALPMHGRGRVIGVLDIQSEKPGAFTQEDATTLQTMADQLASAISNARLYEETRRHVEELTALRNVDMAISSTLDLDGVLRVLHSEISKLMEMPVFRIALYDQDKGTLRFALDFDQGTYLEPHDVKLEDEHTATGSVVRTGEALWIEDAEQEPGQETEQAAETESSMRSLLVLPLTVRDRVIGAMCAQSPKPGAFSAAQRRLFSSIARQAAIAIENAQLLEESRRRLHEARLVQEVMLAAASTLDFDLVLERSVKALHRALGVDRLGFLLPQGQEERLVSHPSLVGFRENDLSVAADTTLPGRAFRTGVPILLRDASQREEFPTLPSEVQSAVAVPVRVGGKVAAVLHAESTSEGVYFGEDELQLLTTVGGQLGVALDNARLYEEMGRHERDLRILAEASAGMIGPLATQEIIDRLVDALVERYGYACAVGLFAAGGTVLELAGGWLSEDEAFPLPVGHKIEAAGASLLKQLTEEHHWMYLEDIAESETWGVISEPVQAMITKYNVTGSVLLPMASQDEVMGITWLGTPKPLQEPLEEHLGWAQTLVNQAAAALSNSELCERLAKQAKELSQAYNELQEISRLRTELVQNVSHEFRTPLSLMQGYTELMLDGTLGKVPENQLAALRTIRDRAATLARLVHNLTMLQVVPREALALSEVSLSEAVRDVVGQFTEPAEEAGITLEVDLEEDPPLVLGDLERLELVIYHLTENAIKFSPGGGKVTVRSWSDDKQVYVSVADTGIGIAPEHLHRIFERFYQVNGTTTRRFGGLGLGLALVWEIVEAHGGSVRASSRPGEGSTFTVAIPRTKRGADQTQVE
jgi:signal transduction histidine kinase/putative methionine-R-sulfoxide reductase with GAF domain